MTVDLEIDKALTYEIYLELIPGSLQPINGVLEFLAEARAAGLRLAVATGSDQPKLDGNLAAIGVAESTFDVVVSAEQVTRKKPDPEAFLGRSNDWGCRPRAASSWRTRGTGSERGAGRGVHRPRDHLVQPADALLGEGAVAVAPDFTALPAEVRAALGMHLA